MQNCHYTTLLKESSLSNLLFTSTPLQCITEAALITFIRFVLAHKITKHVGLTLGEIPDFALASLALRLRKALEGALTFIVHKIVYSLFKAYTKPLLDPKGGARVIHVVIGVLVGTLCALLVIRPNVQTAKKQVKKYIYTIQFILSLIKLLIVTSFSIYLHVKLGRKKGRLTLDEFFAYVDKLQEAKPNDANTFVLTALKEALQIYSRPYPLSWKWIKVYVESSPYENMACYPLVNDTLAVAVYGAKKWQKYYTHEEVVAVWLHELGHAHMRGGKSFTLLEVLVWKVVEFAEITLRRGLTSLAGVEIANVIDDMIDIAYSHKAEYLADSMATILGYGEALRTAFLKMQKRFGDSATTTHPAFSSRIKISQQVEDMIEKLRKKLNDEQLKVAY